MKKLFAGEVITMEQMEAVNSYWELSKGLRKFLDQLRKDENEESNSFGERVLAGAHRAELEELMMANEVDMEGEECPGCGKEPGDELTVECEHENGCGWWRKQKKKVEIERHVVSSYPIDELPKWLPKRRLTT